MYQQTMKDIWVRNTGPANAGNITGWKPNGSGLFPSPCRAPQFKIPKALRPRYLNRSLGLPPRGHAAQRKAA